MEWSGVKEGEVKVGEGWSLEAVEDVDEVTDRSPSPIETASRTNTARSRLGGWSRWGHNRDSAVKASQ